MFRNMRRFKQELSEEDCIRILINEPRGVLACLGDYNYPYTVPMNHVFDGEKLYFHSAKEGHKHDAFENHPKVSYCVLDNGVQKEGEWWYTFKSVVVFGEMKLITDRSEKIDKLTKLGNKLFPREDETEKEISRHLDKCDVFELNIDYMSGKLVREK